MPRGCTRRRASRSELTDSSFDLGQCVNCAFKMTTLLLIAACAMSMIRTVTALLIVFGTASFGLTGQASAQNDVRKGHFLAAHICAICHVAAADQAYPPIMKPPASSFASIAQRMDAESLKNFMATTHRGLNNPKGMPNPQLMDYQINQLVAYILSLRK